MRLTRSVERDSNFVENIGRQSALGFGHFTLVDLSLLGLFELVLDPFTEDEQIPFCLLCMKMRSRAYRRQVWEFHTISFVQWMYSKRTWKSIVSTTSVYE